MLVPCQGCGNQIDTLAAACPRCGRPQAGHLPGAPAQAPRPPMAPQMAPQAPAGKSGFGLWLAIGLGGLGVLVVAAKACMGSGLSAWKDLANSSSTASKSSSSDSERLEPVPSYAKPIVVTAQTLYRDYDENEPAADEKYKGKLLEVDGPIQSIDKDFLGGIRLELDTGKIMSGVTAKLAASQASKAMTLKKKQQVHVRCKGGGRLIQSAMLEDCQIISAAPAAAAKTDEP